VPAHNLMNPGRPPRFDRSALIRHLRRVVLLAPALASLLVLAAAGVASAADDLDLLEAAPVAPVVKSVDPKAAVAPAVAVLKPAPAGPAPVKRLIVKTVAPALPNGSPQLAKAIVRGVEDHVRSIAPVSIPDVIPRSLDQGAGAAVDPRPPHLLADDDSTPPVVVGSAIMTLLVPDHTSSQPANARQRLDGNARVDVPQSEQPLGSVDPAGTTAIDGPGTGQGPWLGIGSWPRIQPARWSGFPPANPFAMSSGFTPGPLVPPG
jgi:hypothetical protein